MTVKSVEIAIVGGGLIGMMSAYFLAKSGYQVIVFDRSGIASESTWAGGGILSPLYPWQYADEINLLASYSQKIYPELVREIENLSGISAEYIQSGLAIDARDIDSNGWQWISAENVQLTNLDNNRKQSSHIAPEKDFVFFPEIAQVRNPRLAQSLSAALIKLNVEFVTDSEVTGFNEVKDGRMKLVTTQGCYSAEKLVISAGAWSAKLMGYLGLKSNIRPVRGQMLLFKANPGFIKPILLAKGHYIIPRNDGRILVGSTMEDVGFDKSITNDARETLTAFVKEYVPELLTFEIEKHWSGLRPGSPKGIPIISQHPEMENVFINTGHFRNGVVLAPASAQLLADLMRRQPSFITPENYSFASFAERAAEI